MSKFTAKIQATLDTSKFSSELKKLEKEKITLTNIDINTTGLAQKIQQALSKQNFKLVVNDIDMSNVAKKATQAGQDAGKQMANAMNNAANSVKLGKNNFPSVNSFTSALKDAGVNNAGIKNTQESLNELYDTVEKINVAPGDKTIKFTVTGVDTMKNAAKVVGELDAATGEFIDAPHKVNISNAESIKTQTQAYRNLISTINEITSVQKELDTIEITGKGSEERVNQLKNRLAELVTKEKEYKDIASQDGGIVAQEERVTNAYSKQKAALEDNILKQKELKATQQELLLNKIPSAQNSFEKWCATNTKAAEAYEQELKELRAEYNALFSNAKSGKDVTKELDAVNTKFKQIQTQAVVEGNTGLTTWDRLKQQVSKYSNYFSVATLTFKGIQELKKMYNNVKDIDEAMTELKKVTDESDSAYSNFLTNATSRAKELGVNIDGLVSSTADFARLGYDMDTAGKLAEVANIYANVGDGVDGVSDATEKIVSTLKAFFDADAGYEEALSVIDKFNEVGNNFSISSGGIGEALKRSAATLASSGNSLSESIALVTTANEIIQNPEKAGRYANCQL